MNMEKSALTPLKRFFNLLDVDRKEIISIYVYALFNGIVTLTIPVGIQAIINLIGGAQVSTSWVVLVVIVIIGIALSGVMQIMQLTISENVQQKIFIRSAFEFAYRIPRMKAESVKGEHLPELANRFFDTLSVQKGLSKILIDFSTATLQVFFGLILLSLYHPFFILFSLVLVIIVYLIFRFTAPSGIRTSLVESKYKYQVAHWLEELARTMETFKLAGNSPLPLEKTDEVVESYILSRKKHFKTLVIQFINLVGFKVIIAAGLLVIGGLLVLNQQMNIGQFVASEIIIILILNSIEKLILSMETIYDVLTAIEKIGMVTDIPLEDNEGIFVPREETRQISVEMTDLSYHSPFSNKAVLKDLNFRIAPGEKICISGGNDAGKTALLQTLAGLYDNFEGSLSYNNIPLGNWARENLHQFIGDNLAREDIFHGTLLENITLGRPEIEIKRVQKICDCLGLSEYVRDLPVGFKTILLPEGKNLSGSLRLKIILARSIAADPGLVLLEDSFNSLSRKDKESFLNFILQENWTVIAISNDVNVARRFDKSLVLQDGKMLAYDHIDALKKADWFKEIYENH